MQWEDYRDLLAGERLPRLVLNLDGLDHNIREVLRLAQDCGKTLRLATKSLRIPAVIRYIREQAPDFFRGLMCYSVEEAGFLWQVLGESLGDGDLLVAYPTARRQEMDLAAELAASGVKLTLMADCAEHLRLLDEAGRKRGVLLRVCLDIDMSYRPVGDLLHLGVRRSPLRTVAQVRELLGEVRRCAHLALVGVMGYEAQVAGLQDTKPRDLLMNLVRPNLKFYSINHIRQLRREVATLLEEEGFTLDYFNGGGSGSLITTPLETAVTEVTAGSVFFLPHLFDHYHHHRFMEPSLFFALQVSRKSDPGFVTCAGGGYIASGAAAKDRLPQPWLPEGLALTDLEGAGEVQTPLRLLKPVGLGLGDPVLFRHAKAGELAEHFASVLLVRERKVVGEELTYRGYGKSFL